MSDTAEGPDSADYCRKCGVFLSGGMIDRDEDDATLCWECGDNDLWDIPAVDEDEES